MSYYLAAALSVLAVLVIVISGAICRSTAVWRRKSNRTQSIGGGQGEEK